MKELIKIFLVLTLLLPISIGILLGQQGHSERQYLALEKLCDRAQSPRLLNTLDVESLLNSVQNPSALVSPLGDYDRNGIEDEALSGIYNLPSGKFRYFLLVATREPRTNQPKAMYFQEYEKPVFLFLPGSTGKADPHDQAFSFSHCLGCSIGADFYWNSKTQQFDIKSWSTRIIHSQVFVEGQDVEVPENIIDIALAVVGRDAGVINFVKESKSQGVSLATHVTSTDPSLKHVRVTLATKMRSQESIFAEFMVDTVDQKIIESVKGQDRLK